MFSATHERKPFGRRKHSKIQQKNYVEILPHSAREMPCMCVNRATLFAYSNSLLRSLDAAVLHCCHVIP